MTIADELQKNLVTAMRAKDKATLNAIRNARAELQKAIAAPGFDGDQGDAFCENVIAGYVKTLTKNLQTYEEIGERGAAHAAKLRTEIEYLSQWLPKKLDETETATLVDEAITQAAASDPQQAGRVVGLIMKAHSANVDVTLVRRLVDARLKAESD